MPRRKQFLKVRLPFFKFRVKKDMFFNVIGILLWGMALLSLFSFFVPSGETLLMLSRILREKFGFLAVVMPIILASFGTHFFNSKKLKLIKPHVTVGLILMFSAFLGVFRTGLYGNAVYEALSADFSLLGAIVILFIMFVVGIILFFNTSLDAFLLLVVSGFSALASYLKKDVFRDVLSKQKVEETNRGDEFITDRKAVPIINRHSQHQPNLAKSIAPNGLHMKPYKPVTGKWEYPPLSLLADMNWQKADAGDIKKSSGTIETTLESFGIRARVFEINEGPTITQYALEIVRGTKLSKITGLGNDLALALAAPTGQVRIEAPIPGRSLVGIEIPNRRAEIVPLKRLLQDPLFASGGTPLTVPLGLDVSGKAQGVDITKMPHILIAGTTGAGKSVLLNSWICSILFRATPEEVRLILIDPKRVELTLYNGIPHLMTEVIIEPKKIISALQWTVSEMENRYKQFAKVRVRNIEGYNIKDGVEPIPHILFIIDELADLMIFAPGEAEELITRIAQMARATGIYLILATQRPSVDVITGLMKANIPARIAFNVASMIDSRVVLDMPGAEKLLGKGDMLFLPPDQAKPRRIQGPFITEKDVVAIVEHLKKLVPEVHYTEEVTEQEVQVRGRGGRMNTMLAGDRDSIFEEAVRAIYEQGKASSSLLQRKLSIGYARAARILDQLETEGYIGPAQGSKPREILSRSPQDPEIQQEQ